MASIQFTKEIDDEIIAAASKHNIDPNTLRTIVWIESKGDPNAQNPVSSAKGLMQFIDKTAAGYKIKDRFDFKEALDKGAKLAADNKSYLKKTLKREPTSSELYLAHQQGATGASKLLKNPDLNILKVSGMDKDKVEKNAGNINMTAGEFAKMWTDKADTTYSAIPITPTYRDLEVTPFPVTRKENTAVDTSPRPQMRPQQQEVPAVSVVPQQVPQPLAVEQAVMEASAMPVPPSQPSIQQVPLRPAGGVIPLRLDELNQGTQEVMPRGYEDGTGFVDYFKNLFSTDYQPVPGDMRGSPQGVLGLSNQQLIQANEEMDVDRTAFNPVVPPMSSNIVIPGRNMDVAMGDDSRARVPSAYINDERVKPYLQPGMTYTVNDNTVEYNPSVPPVMPERNINKEKLINSMTQEEAYGILQNPESTEESILNARKFLSGNFEVASEKPEVLMTPEQAISVFQDPNANEAERFEARKALGGEVYSGRGDFGMPTPPVVEQDSATVEYPAVVNEESKINLYKIPADINRENVLNDMDEADLPGEKEANSFGTTMGELGNKLGPIFKSLFGLETQDMTRALGFYLMSRLSGASHEGSMRWAGGTVLKQAEARGIRNSARADAAAKAFTAVSGNYTKQAASKIRKELLEGNIVAAQALMDNAENKTARGKLGIDANATGTFYMIPGYTKAMEVFEGTGGNRYTKTTKTVNGKQVETYVPLSSEMMGQLRERNQDDDIASYLAAVRAHVNTMNEDLFKSEYTDDGKVVREKGIFEGRGKAGVTEDIMRISRELGEKGMRNDPRELMTMVSKGAELAKAMGVNSINAKTLFEMQFVGGDILFDQSKISKDGEIIPSSKIKSFTGDFQKILGGNKNIINDTMNTAASKWNPEVTMESIKSSTNYQGLSADEKQKIDSAPSDFMAFALLTAYANKT